jgi:hypothetical protein
MNKMKWKVVGIGIYKKYAVVWFGERQRNKTYYLQNHLTKIV